jgi:hypothetical protein
MLTSTRIYTFYAAHFRDPFTATQRLLILKAIEKVQGVLKERGLDPLPVSRYEYFTPMHEYGVEE